MLAVHSLEVGVILLVLDHTVVLVLEDLGAVREFALYHDKKKDTHREKVDASTVILVVSQDLRSYVARRANSTGDLSEVTSCAESEIDKLEGQLTVDQDILKLEVTVNNTSILVKILKTVKHLLEEEASSVLTDTYTS